MSYCHLTTAGISFEPGFGVQEGAVMRNRVMAAGCVEIRPVGPEPPEECEQDELIVELSTDLHPRETAWIVRNEAEEVILQGGPFDKSEWLTDFRSPVCLDPGCYTFTIFDEEGDGISSQDFGPGAYRLILNGDTIASGGDFGFQEEVSFCVSIDPEECEPLDLSEIASYGTNQDAGVVFVDYGGQEITIRGNGWKSIPLEYTVTERTVLKLSFRAGPIGEIHGIGFDNNDVIGSNQTFRLAGTQSWGIPSYSGYQPADGWVDYEIPVGNFYRGDFDRLFFVNDKDLGTANNESSFRNVRVCEDGTGVTSELPAPAEGEFDLPVIPEPYPNPTSGLILLPEPGEWTVFNLTGQSLSSGSGSQIDLSEYPQGVYLVRRGGKTSKIVKR
ncbi:T9SS type A sorting domain-containing protein [Lewinella sp. W8]|uniref:T9SS type A sorting domain-containing protein n=1 Tax=Lewinella sp. W8 TaxID=2528208 RepID=UPI0020A67818|nr:T9SS type A sorting domain-containing protein [Lewinella sp. W8]